MGRGKHVAPGVLPPQPQLSRQAGSWAEQRGPRGGQGLLAPDRSALTPEGYALGREATLTWVNRALLPFRVGNDLVFVHHLDVLILHLIAGGRERKEGSTPAVRPR